MLMRLSNNMKQTKSYKNPQFLSLQSKEGSLFTEDFAPDELSFDYGVNIPDDFVLCRNAKGEATAIFSGLTWDFTPYRLATKGTCSIFWEKLAVSGDDRFDKATLLAAKKTYVLIMFLAKTGKAGPLSVTTLRNYADTLFSIVEFGAKSQKNRMLGKISFQDILSNKTYLAHYAKTLTKRRKQSLHALLMHLKVIGEEKLGFSVVYEQGLHEKIPHKQHPIIPTRIYLELINYLTGEVEYIKKRIGRISNFIRKFEDPYYGLHKKVQRRQAKADGVEGFIERVTFPEAVEEHRLNALFQHFDIEPRSRASLVALITSIQFKMKFIIHLYTGMRNDEVNRLPYRCVHEEHLEDEKVGENGESLAAPEVVNLLSTTTKFSGYRKEESWLAHSTVLKAVSSLQAIVRSYAEVVGGEPNAYPLLVSTVKIFLKNHFDADRSEVTTFKNSNKSFLSNPEFRITEADFEVLQASDPDRNFADESKFNVGMPWPLTSHQSRRSLAFYALNSGFVSLPTLAKQFKHLSQEMSRYYSRNFENVTTIFGHYDVKAKKYVLPLNHIALEVQVGMSLETAEAILNDLMDEGVKLHGKTGSYLERQRSRLNNGEVLVEELKDETVKKVNNGEFSYRKTLLGGCTNDDVCECSILGEFADCLTSSCAVIKSGNVDELIASTTKELSTYNPESVEYLATKEELDELVRYKRNQEKLAQSLDKENHA